MVYGSVKSNFVFLGDQLYGKKEHRKGGGENEAEVMRFSLAWRWGHPSVGELLAWSHIFRRPCSEWFRRVGIHASTSGSSSLLQSITASAL